MDYGLGYKTRTEHYGLGINTKKSSTLNKFHTNVFTNRSYLQLWKSHFPKVPTQVNPRSHRFKHTRLPKKKYRDTESPKINELYEFLNDPSHDSMFNSREN